MNYCPKCNTLVCPDEDACLCAACGWFGDVSETTQDVQASVRESAEAMLDLFRDMCHKEQLAEAIAADSGDTNLDMPRIRLAIQMSKGYILSLISSLAERPRILTTINGMVPWPQDWTDRHYSTNEPCDMLIGPCACGGWHTANEKWVQEALTKHGAIIK